MKTILGKIMRCMKHIILTISMALVLRTSYSQILNNSSDGEGSTLFPGGAFSFDLGTSALGFSYVYYGDSSFSKSGYFGGLSVQAKNNEGISNLFNKGDFTPEGKGKLIIGRAWVWGENSLQKAINKLDSLSKAKHLSDSLFYIKLSSGLDSMFVKNIQDVKKRRLAKDEKDKGIETGSFKQLLKRIDDLTIQEESLGSALEKATEYILIEVDDYAREQKGIKEKLKQLRDSVANSNTWLNRFSIYLEGGMNALSFKKYELVDSSNFSNNFTDKNFQGGDIRLGLNWQHGGSWLFGIALGYKNYNSFTLLTDKEYVVKNTLTSSSQQQTIEKKMTAYTGKYNVFNQTYLFVDVIHFRKLDKKTIVAINPYFKLRMSSNATVYPDVKDIGLNLFFFKPKTGKLSGGIYVELPDIDNNLERLEDEPNLRRPENRLNFGVVAKFNIGSLPGYSN
jgi:hypothetical protein